MARLLNSIGCCDEGLALDGFSERVREMSLDDHLFTVLFTTSFMDLLLDNGMYCGV